MYSVLLVEDDSQIREVIGDYFGRRDKISLDFAEDGLGNSLDAWCAVKRRGKKESRSGRCARMSEWPSNVKEA